MRSRERLVVGFLCLFGVGWAAGCGSADRDGFRGSNSVDESGGGSNADASTSIGGVRSTGGKSGGGAPPSAHCTNSLDCAGNTDGRVICDRDSSICVECGGNGDCDSGATCFANHCRKPCSSDRDCVPLGLPACHPSA